jgi:hypothetical protein
VVPGASIGGGEAIPPGRKARPQILKLGCLFSIKLTKMRGCYSNNALQSASTNIGIVRPQILKLFLNYFFHKYKFQKQ